MKQKTKERCKGLVSGVVIGALLVGGGVFAKNATEMIEVEYSNIKVYKDNVLCELKDANGSVIEPFIYNGTTYMPVRGTAKLADMDITWDGATQSVYLWDEMVPNGTYLMDVCPPYGGSFKAYLPDDGQSFSMGGTKYSNGFTISGNQESALINLNGKYSSVNLAVGHVDDSFSLNQNVMFFVDGKLVKELFVGWEDLPQEISIPVTYGLQLKIVTGDEAGWSTEVGFGNITVN